MLMPYKSGETYNFVGTNSKEKYVMSCLSVKDFTYNVYDFPGNEKCNDDDIVLYGDGFKVGGYDIDYDQVDVDDFASSVYLDESEISIYLILDKDDPTNVSILYVDEDDKEYDASPLKFELESKNHKFQYKTDYTLDLYMVHCIAVAIEEAESRMEEDAIEDERRMDDERRGYW